MEGYLVFVFFFQQYSVFDNTVSIELLLILPAQWIKLKFRRPANKGNKNTDLLTIVFLHEIQTKIYMTIISLLSNFEYEDMKLSLKKKNTKELNYLDSLIGCTEKEFIINSQLSVIFA